MSKIIRVNLFSPESIDQAVRQIEDYKNSLNEKARTLARRVAETVQWNAQSGFSSAVADDIFVGGSPVMSDVSVSMEDNGNVCVVFASGDDAVFIEFGAGVYHNGGKGMIGNSPHPKGKDLGFTIGEYGKKQGRKNAWDLPGGNRAAPILTHGTPAAMPMYNGLQQAINQLTDIAREVFAS